MAELSRLDKARMTQSMSRVSRYIDNGPMEGFWCILKREMYPLGRFKDYDSLLAALRATYTSTTINLSKRS